MPDKLYRTLDQHEITQLETQGCSCDDWKRVQVGPGFDAAHIRNVGFSGEIRIGKTGKKLPMVQGATMPAGIRNAFLHNCSVGDDVLINNVGMRIVNYSIENGVQIQDVGLIEVEGRCCFGNGTEVQVVNESGVRSVPIFDGLSAQLAHVLCFYRYRPRLVTKLQKTIAAYARGVTGNNGVIGKESRLFGCKVLKNVKVGENCLIEGVERLENGSINSTADGPVIVSGPVIARNFIVSSSSNITDGAVITDCFIGQGCRLGRGLSAENTLFFANCEGYLGEFCSVFAGPFTVSHHRSTLLIGAALSFFNAGSGTNQSNHMYRTGPVHQGVLRRGAKTGSGAYLLWPSVLDVFSVVKGRHFKNLDLAGLPFSYIIESAQGSIVVPGGNLTNVGLYRDARKWRRRDRRKGSEILDTFVPAVLSPFVMERVEKGIELLRALVQEQGEDPEWYTTGGVLISSKALHSGIDQYNTTIDYYLGDCLSRRLAANPFRSFQEVREMLAVSEEDGQDRWLDLGGLLAPQEPINGILKEIEQGKAGSLSDMQTRFGTIAGKYADYEWTWASGRLAGRLGRSLDKVEPTDLKEFLIRWKVAVRKRFAGLLEDASKEFSDRARIGYGIDGDEGDVKKDFAKTRGVQEKDTTVEAVKQEIREKERLADQLIQML